MLNYKYQNCKRTGSTYDRNPTKTGKKKHNFIKIYNSSSKFNMILSEF